LDAADFKDIDTDADDHWFILRPFNPPLIP